MYWNKNTKITSFILNSNDMYHSQTKYVTKGQNVLVYDFLICWEISRNFEWGSFNTVLTTARHFVLSCSRSIQSTLQYTECSWYIHSYTKDIFSLYLKENFIWAAMFTELPLDNHYVYGT
jgi:hypothetical protein